MAGLYIGICDDQLEIAQILKENIESIQVKRDKRWKIEIFTSGEALLEVVKALDVIFLDIEMPKLDGIETGEKIRRINPYCKIIMATGKVERF